MEITKDTATKNITVQGLALVVPQPFDEGHTLNANEAMALNQVLAENLRNNFASRIRASKDEAEKAGKEYKPDEAALQEELNAYAAEYEFGVKRSGTSTAHLDPVEKEVQVLGRTAIKQALQANGYKLKDIPKEKMEELIAGYISQNLDVLTTNAQAIVDSRNTINSGALEGLQL